MQSWSQQVDPNLQESDLPFLATKLDLPQGWKYQTRFLKKELVIDTQNKPAIVSDNIFFIFNILANVKTIPIDIINSSIFH